MRQRLSLRGRPVAGDELPADRGDEVTAVRLPAVQHARSVPLGLLAWASRPPCERKLTDAALTEKIEEVHAGSGKRYGTPKIHAKLADGHDIRVGRKRVARLMKKAKIVGVMRGKKWRTTIADPAAPPAPGLVDRAFAASAPNQLWLADITYLPTASGFLCLAVIIDMFSHMVVGWSRRSDMKADLVVDALSMAVARRGPGSGLVHHSDRGSHYTSLAFSAKLDAFEITPSMGSRGDARDNAVAESFMAIIKTELTRRCPFANHAHVRAEIFECIETFYNHRRRHSALGHKSRPTPRGSTLHSAQTRPRRPNGELSRNRGNTRSPRRMARKCRCHRHRRAMSDVIGAASMGNAPSVAMDSAVTDQGGDMMRQVGTGSTGREATGRASGLSRISFRGACAILVAVLLAAPVAVSAEPHTVRDPHASEVSAPTLRVDRIGRGLVGVEALGQDVFTIRNNKGFAQTLTIVVKDADGVVKGQLCDAEEWGLQRCPPVLGANETVEIRIEEDVHTGIPITIEAGDVVVIDVNPFHLRGRLVNTLDAFYIALSGSRLPTGAWDCLFETMENVAEAGGQGIDVFVARSFLSHVLDGDWVGAFMDVNKFIEAAPDRAAQALGTVVSAPAQADFAARMGVETFAQALKQLAGFIKLVAANWNAGTMLYDQVTSGTESDVVILKAISTKDAVSLLSLGTDPGHDPPSPLVVDPLVVQVGGTRSLTVRVRNDGPWLPSVWVMLSIYDSEGRKVESSQLPPGASVDPQTHVNGAILFPAQGESLDPGEIRDFVAEYKFGTSSAGHTYIGGRYTCVVQVLSDGYPGQTFSKPVSPAISQRLLVQDSVAPAAPADLSAVGGSGHVALSWAPNREPDVTTYEIRRSTSPDGPWTAVLDSVAAPGVQYVDAAVADGTTYHYRVDAVDLGNQRSALSTVASARPGTAPRVSVAADTTRYATGERARVTVQVSGAAENPVDADQTPRVELSGSVVQVVREGCGLYVGETGPLAEGEHQLRAEASVGGFVGVASSEIMVAGDLSIPSGLSCSVASNHVGLTWNACAGAVGYRVYRGVGGGTTTSYVAVDANSYTDFGVVSGTLYEYRVTAVDASGSESMPSESAYGTPMTAPVLSLSASSMAPSIALQNTWFPVGQIVLNATDGATTLDALKPIATGTVSGDDVDIARLYEDVDGNGALDESTDNLLAESQRSYEGKYVFRDLGLLVEPGRARRLLVVYHFAYDAQLSRLAGMRLESADCTLRGLGEIQGSLPFNSSQTSVGSGDTLGPDVVWKQPTPTTLFTHGPVRIDCSVWDGAPEGVMPNASAGAEYYVDQVRSPGSGTPLTVSDGAWDEVLEDAHVVIDASGWPNGMHTVWVRGRDVLGNWGTPTAFRVLKSVGTVQSLSAFGDGRAQRSMVRDSAGTIHFAFSSGSALYYTSSADGITWAAPVQVNIPGQYAWYPSLDVDANRNVHLVFEGNGASPSGAYYAKRDASSGTWTTPAKLSSGGLTSYFYPRIAIDGAGTLHVVYVDYPVGHSDQLGLYYIRNAGSGWASPAVISGSLYPQGRPSNLAVAPNGDIHVVMPHGGGGVYATRRSAAAGTWDAPVALVATGGETWPTVCVAGNTPYAAYRDESGGISVCSREGDTWSSPTRISGSTTAARYPLLSADELNRVYLAWREDDPSRLRLAYAANGSTWTEPVTISDTLTEGYYPIAPCMKDGQGFDVLWAERAEPAEETYFAVFKTLTPDTVAPTVSISSPSPGEAVPSRILVSGTASDANMSRYRLEWASSESPDEWVEFYSNGVSVTDGSLGVLDADDISHGTQISIRLTATDLWGNQASTAVSVSVDKRSPLISQVEADHESYSPNGDGVQDDTNITFHIDEEAWVSILIYDADNTLVRTHYGGILGTGVHPIAWGGEMSGASGVVEDGVYTMMFEARDARGNVGAPVSQTFVVDTSAPSASVGLDSPEVAGIQMITGTAQDATLRAYRVECRAAGSVDPWVLLREGSAPVTDGPVAEWDTTKSVNQGYEIRIVAVDAAGNVREEDTAATVHNVVSPSGFVASAANEDVRLTWSLAEGAPSCRVLRSTSTYASNASPGADQIMAYEGTAEEFVDQTDASTRYYYTAFAKDSTGKWSYPSHATIVSPAHSGDEGVAPSTCEVAGATRYDTAIEASKKAFPSGAPAVVIATGANWPDALGGSALAGVVDGPLLLTPPTALPDSVAAEVSRLGATRAYVLGGTGAVSSAVENSLRSKLGGGNVTRIAGADRYNTALKVADEVIRLKGAEYDGHAFLATGANFPDALGASPIAAGKGRPVLLCPFGGDPSLPSATSRVVILGGTGAVAPSTENDLVDALGREDVSRIGGADRYETAALAARFGVEEGMEWDCVGIATGAAFPDALSGGAMLGRLGSVMLLTPGTALCSSAEECLANSKAEISCVYFIGGTGAVSAAVRTRVEQVIR